MIHGPNSQFSGAFSMGKKQETSIINSNPGPNQYTVSSLDKPKTFLFPKAIRKPLYEPNEVPFAYDYNLQTVCSNPPTIKFAKAIEIEKPPIEIGPGSYNWTDCKKSPAFTFQSKFEPIANETIQVPGPGSYDVIESQQPKPLNKGFTTSKRFDALISNGPGPGEKTKVLDKYQVALDCEQRFPKQPKSLERSETGPGPGAFLTTIQSTSKGISFGKKLQAQSEKHFVPGPGSYYMKSFTDIQNKGSKIGSSNRSQMLLKQGPSPLDYDVTQFKYPSKHTSFVKAERRTMKIEETTPGPGAYQLETILKKHGPIIPKASKEVIIHEILPGPGKYNLNEPISKGPSYHIAGKYESPQEQSIVGPGRYHISREITDGPKYKFAKMEKSVDDQNQSHFYDIQQSIGHIPSYLLNN